MKFEFSYADYCLFTICWIALGILTGIYLFRQEAPYGRFSNKYWGPMINNRLGWLLMEATVMLVLVAWLLTGKVNWGTPVGLVVLLFLLHYIHRSLIYPFMIRTKGKKMPLVIALSAMLFNTVNGSLLGIWLVNFADYPANWYHSFPFLIGLTLFFAGMLLNWRSDYQLIHLRKKGETGYVIPQKGLFKYVSSPNLLGEIIEWGGFAILSWSLPALAFFIWTCANLVPRAVANHRWYKKQFTEYPTARRILFPFIW